MHVQQSAKSVGSIQNGGEELGEHDRYYVKYGFKRKVPPQSPPDNIKRTKTLDDFIKEKGKERYGFFRKKKIQIPVVPLLVSGHLRPKHSRT